MKKRNKTKKKITLPCREKIATKEKGKKEKEKMHSCGCHVK